MLDTLGLDEACANVYRTLLAQPRAGLEDLRRLLGISEHELRAALDKLSEMALIRPSLNEPHTFRAVDPKLGLHSMVAQEQERLAAEQRRVEQLRAAADRLTADFAASRPHKSALDVERLDGIEEIRDRIHVLVRAVKAEVMTLAPGGAQSAASMEAAKPQDRELLGRGVRMRTLYLDSVRNSPPTVAYAKWLSEQGGEVRTVPSLPIRLMLLDRDVAIVPTDGDNSAAGALVVTANGTLTALCALFDSIWETAMPLGQVSRDRGRDERGLTSQEAEALRMLSQGLTDEAVAKRLGVSPRTARRIAADLMELLGARSRFQAGARAVAKGWLTGEE
ncbi:helix-turn-helix domain-containing protein [Streptomyces albidoflavus]|uniref:helix-turn-helix transcriptional regulator n=1 Tax=Streptomyces TaxID=1883 RepID=UPI00063EBA2F|nr:LuxR family transcriptional regulator [Streptomyces sp. KE1]KLI96690.1 erythropoiesis-stimulating protein [Streptomyces sp. KE1]